MSSSASLSSPSSSSSVPSLPSSTVSSLITNINALGKYLARQDILNIDQLPTCDLLILLGSEIYGTAALAAEIYHQHKVPRILISGGIGHSTHRLYNQIHQLQSSSAANGTASDSIYTNIQTQNRSEADILYDILHSFGVPSDKVYIENKSTNCGQNAEFAYQTLESLVSASSIPSEKDRAWLQTCINGPAKIILIQDPTMQRRSHASFEKWWKENSLIEFISYAPFIPEIILSKQKEEKFQTNSNYELPIESLVSSLQFTTNSNFPGIWTIDRYFNLLAGEIPRLRNTSTGYGPKGKNFIVAVDIPDHIEVAYEQFLKYIPEANR